MLKCKTCGFPKVFNHLVQWNDNGTITIPMQQNFRVLIIEADLLTKLVTSIEDELELPVRRMLFETQRDASKAVIDTDFSGYMRFARRGPFKRLSIRFLDRMAGWTGQAYCRTTRYRPGTSSEGVMRNPFDRDLIAAIVVGAMESLEGAPYLHRWEKREREDIIFAEPDPDRPSRDRFILSEFTPLKPGRHHLERCARCGAPLALRDLKWVEEEGIIMDIRKGIRMVFLDFYAFKIVVEKLAKELGPEFAPIVVDTQRAFFIRHIWEEFLSERRGNEPLSRHELYRQVLDTLALRGQGNPVEHTLKGERFSVTIENPFNEFLLAGFLSALYECNEGKVPQVKWERLDEQTLRFTLEPRGV